MMSRDRRPARWWDEEAVPEERGRALVDTAKAVETSGAELWRSDMNILYGSLYEGRPLTSLYQYGGAAALSGDTSAIVEGAEVTWNLVRSVVQTVASQVSRARPRCRFITSGGTYKQKRRAKKLTQFTDGLFAETRLYTKTQQAFVDGGVFDVGAVEVFRDNDRVRVERVLACEVLIPQNEAVGTNAPRTIYRRKFIDRDVLRARFGDTEEKREAIDKARSADPANEGASTNLVEAYEGWHLRSSKDSDDGRHIIAIDGPGGTLLEEPWTKDYFPIVIFFLDPALSGPYGRSAADVLMGIQIAVNTGLDKIARAQHLAAVPRVAIPRGSKVSKSQLTNAIGSMIEFSGGQPPIWFTPQALSPEVYQHLEKHFQRGFELYGVNAKFAAGATDTGAAAIKVREDLDVQTARFAVLAQRWEDFHMDIARIMVDLARDIYKDNGAMRVSAPGTELLDSIDWKDVNLEEDEFVIQPYPTSLLPTTPQGRIDRVRQLVSDGIWKPERAEAALDDLDVESAMSGQRAAEKDIERMCESMLVDGEYEAPEPWMDLGSCMRLGAQHLASARIEKAPAKHIDLLYRFLDDTQALIQAVKMSAAPPPAPPGQPPGAPAPQLQRAA